MSDSNKEEAARCVQIAEAALASGDKQRSLKFLRIAQSLNPNLSLETLIASCQKPDSSSLCQTAEQVKLIKVIKSSKNYYAMLGVEKFSSSKEIRKAYRKLCLRVHPDKNKAPGAEEAFNLLCNAFKCLSDENSRKQYDQTSATRDTNITPSRKKDEVIFQSFSADRLSLQAHHWIQILFLAAVFFIAVILNSEPEFTLQQTPTYKVPRITEKHGVKYYVSSEDFDQQYPEGSQAREKLEHEIVADYVSVLRHHCRIEMRRRKRLKNYQSPHCDKLQSLITT